MTVQAQTPARHATRLTLALAAIAGLILSLYFVLSPVSAGEGNIVYLNESQQGTDSSEDADAFKCESEPPAPGEVLWHFVLNGVSPGIESALTINAEFDEDGVLNDESSWNPGGSTHQFFIITSGDDILLDAWVDIGGSTANNLVLSHICRGAEVEETPTPTPEGSEAGGTGTPAPTPTPTPEGSQAGGTGTPVPSLPSTDLSLPGIGGSLATILFGAVLFASLGALAYANVQAVRRRS